MAQPASWKRYVDGCKFRKQSPEAALARFAARYSVATDVQALNFKTLGTKSAAGYTAALRVTLAYSALESLDVALGSKTRTSSVINTKLADAYSSASLMKLRALLLRELDSKRLLSELEALSAGEHSDIVAVAAGIRHLFCHGDFSAYGAGLAQSAAAQRFLDALAQAVLGVADERFESFLDQTTFGPWDVPQSKRCPSCRVAVGSKHVQECTIGRCKPHGEQRAFCLADGRHAPTTFRGVYPGSIEALKRGWKVRTKQGLKPDLNRVLAQLQWNPDSEMFE